MVKGREIIGANQVGAGKSAVKVARHANEGSRRKKGLKKDEVEKNRRTQRRRRARELGKKPSTANDREDLQIT